MIRRLLLLLALLVAAGPAPAQMALVSPRGEGEHLEIGTSTNEIAITSDFSGADLTVFGSLDNTDSYLLAIGQYDIVVSLEGPKNDATVRRKDRIFGIWVNRESMTFELVPQSYSLASTRDIAGVAGVQALDAQGVGITHIPLIPAGYAASNDKLTEFRDSFRRLMQTNGLYRQEAGGVRFVSPSLFRATLRLPANIPNGQHTVRATLFKAGVYVTEKTLPLRVVKTGLEQALTNAAHEQPFAYGLFAVFLALVTGWLGSLLFRRD